jgi:hypothetical protein
MNIKDIPADYKAFERFNVAYEREHFRYAETNASVGAATRDMFLSWFSRPLRPLVRLAIDALMDEPLLTAFGFPRPSPSLRRLVEGALRLRGRAVRLLPARRRPVIRTELKHRSYPHGYFIEELGPPAAHSADHGPDGCNLEDGQSNDGGQLATFCPGRRLIRGGDATSPGPRSNIRASPD